MAGLVFGDPNGLTRDEQNRNGEILRAWAKANAELLGFQPDAPIEIPSFHPIFRVGERGALKIDMVVELVQTRHAELFPGAAASAGRPALTFPVRGGVTLMIAQTPLLAGRRGPPQVRYAIAKQLKPGREDRQRNFYAAQGLTARVAERRLQIDFSLIHAGI